MTVSPFQSREADRLSYMSELSPSMLYRELERFHIDSIYDPMSSTSDAANYFKLQDARVIGNDLALYAYVKGKALCENNVFTVPASLTEKLADKNAALPKLYYYKTLGGDWLTDDERRWLEYWRSVINDTRDEFIRALAETSVCLVIDYWLTVKRFGQSADWTPPSLLDFYINHVNRSILDNNESNEMWITDPIKLTEKVTADVMFINPPPLKGYAAFGDREHILESWLRGTSDYPLAKIATKGALGSNFANLKKYMQTLSELLQASEHIPIWVFTLSNRQPFTRLEFNDLIRSLGRNMREVDLQSARQFFSRRAPDTLVIATM
jgi:adenine-specific DNA methylase